jgi:RNA polymerase sigma-70 factor (ECF subfamily)
MKENEIQNLIKETKKLVLSTIQRYIIIEAISYIDDIVQEVYIRLVLSLESGQFQNKSKLTTYLYKIAKNETLRFNEKIIKENKKKKKLKNYGSIQKICFIKIKDNNDQAIFIDQLLLEREYLNPLQKEILSLYLKGHKLKEIAQKLNLQEGTVKSNLFRIKNKIRNNEV